MFQAKENFLDRIEQSFIIFKKNILVLSIPFIIFNLFIWVILPAILMIVLLNIISIKEVVWWNISAIVNMVFSLAFIFILFITVYFLFLIPVQVGTIISIKQAINKWIITPKKNILYSFYHLGDLFRTYWYIFSYVMLLPATIFILWGFFIIVWLSQWVSYSDSFMFPGYIIIGISIILGLFFSIYRGIRSTFAIISAIDNLSFTKENFQSSINISKGKWWRVFWNIIGVSIIGWLLMGLITTFIDGTMSPSINISEIFQASSDIENIGQMLEGLMEFNILSFIAKALWNTLWTLLGVFILIFTYIFFKRLEGEDTNKNSWEKSEKAKK